MICCYATIGVIWPHITSSQLSNTKPDTEYKMSYVNLFNRIYFAVTSRELCPMLDSNCEYSMTNLWCRLWIFVKITIIHNWSIHWFAKALIDHCYVVHFCSVWLYIIWVQCHERWKLGHATIMACLDCLKMRIDRRLHIRIANFTSLVVFYMQSVLLYMISNFILFIYGVIIPAVCMHWWCC